MEVSAEHTQPCFTWADPIANTRQNAWEGHRLKREFAPRLRRRTEDVLRDIYEHGGKLAESTRGPDQ